MVGGTVGKMKPHAKRDQKRPREEEETKSCDNHEDPVTTRKSPAKRLKFDEDGSSAATPTKTPSKVRAAVLSRTSPTYVCFISEWLLKFQLENHCCMNRSWKCEMWKSVSTDEMR